MNKTLLLSHYLNKNTPTYGNYSKVLIEGHKCIGHGDSCNSHNLSMNLHIGTHIDLPNHFYDIDFDVRSIPLDFWAFKKVLFINPNPSSLLAKDSIRQCLEKEIGKEYEALIIKFGGCHKRDQEDFWKNNIGIHKDVGIYLREYFPTLRVIGFDSISLSSFQHREHGRESHKVFLDPENPILIVEDMDLTCLDKGSIIQSMTISPLFIEGVDSFPCTIFSEVRKENG